MFDISRKDKEAAACILLKIAGGGSRGGSKSRVSMETLLFAGPSTKKFTY